MSEEEETTHHITAARIAIEGSSPNEGGDVTLEISARGSVIGVVAKQGEDDEEQTIEMFLSLSDFHHFLVLSQALLGIAVEDAGDGDE